MGILDNLEGAWDEAFQFESKPIVETDAMGREKFWEDMGRPDFDAMGIYSIEALALPVEEPNLAVKLFSETCCAECNCKNV
jgi:hypothetical protein